MSVRPAPDADPEVTLPGDDIGFVLRRAQLTVFQEFQSLTEGFGLRPAEWSTLDLLSHMPGLRQNQAAELLAVKPANFAVLIDRLAARDLVRREPIESDRRALALSLTAAGIALLDRMAGMVEAHRSSLKARLGPGGAAALLDLLNRLIYPPA